METEGAQSIAEPASTAEQQPVPSVPPRHKPRIPDWRPLAKRVGATVAAIAAVGAVLSGLSGYWSTYKVVVGELIGVKPAVQTQSAAAFQPPRLSIAVMPFENLSGDPSQDYFGDGIVENLTTDLSVNVTGLLVIARGSAFAYKGQQIDPKKVGRELNVRYLVQGSVLRAGNQVRINARLIDTEGGEQLWADRFNGDTANVISLQDQMTARISNSLRFKLVALGPRRIDKQSNADAFDLLLRAQATLGDERRLNVYPRKKAEDAYRLALAADPGSADIQTGLASVLAENLYNSRLNPSSKMSDEQIAAAKTEIADLLQQASRTGPLSAEGHSARANVSGYERKFDDAEREFEQAKALNPNSVGILYLLANNRLFMGAPETALPLFDDIWLRGGDKSPIKQGILGSWGITYLILGRYDEAIKKLQEAQAAYEAPANDLWLSIAYVQLGDMDAARPHFEKYQAWITPRRGPSTIKRAMVGWRSYSEAPAFVKLVEANYLPGLRKLGVPEE
jgi:TolB-like protein